MPPLNDDIANAIVLSGASGLEVGDNTGATFEANEQTAVGGTFDTRSVWYAWTAPDGSDITFWTTALDGTCVYIDLSDSVLTILDGNDFLTATVVAQNDDFCGSWSEVTFTPTASATYWVCVCGYGDSPQGGFELHWGTPSCTYGATTETADGITSHSAVGHGTLCNPAFTSRYRFQYGTTTGYGTNTAYFAVAIASSEKEVSAILASCADGLTPGTTYHYRVQMTGPGGTVNGADQTFTTDGSGSAPANDDIGSAIAISGAGGTADGDNADATLEANEGALLYDVDNSIGGTALGYGGGRSQWWAWTAPADGYYGFWVESRNGRDYLGNVVGDGLCDAIVTVLDGNDFATAVVLAQNEYADGQEGGKYPWSLAQFHATAGNVYYIAVDGYNGTKPSDGGYNIADTQVGPFTLHWAGAVCASPCIRNPVLLAVTATTATIQFDIYPNDPAGADYFAATTTPAVVSSPTGHEATAFAWTTVTRTIAGLTPNTSYVARGYVQNDCDSNSTSDVYFVTALGAFAACPALLDDFNQADCTAPANFDTVYTPGTADLRIFSNEVGIYRCDTYVRAYREGDPILYGALTAADLWITLVVVDDKQDVGWGSGGGAAGDWFGRSDSDAGEAQIIHWDGATETVIASVAQVFVDGDKLGFRWWTNGDLTVYRFNGGVWTSLVTAVGAVPAGSRPPYYNYPPVIGQGQDEVTPPIPFGDLFDLSTYGVTPGPVGSGCPAGTDKYVWSQAQWRCGYYGDSNSGCVPPIDCQQYWLGLTVFPHGRIDCYNDTWSLGDAPYSEAYLGGFGTGYGALPFYPQAPDYDAMFDDLDARFGGFYVYDSDFAYKCYAAIQSTIDTVAAAFAGQGANIITCTDPGDGRVSRGVLMPVPPSIGRMDDLWFSDGRCAPVRIFKPQIVRYT